MNDFKNPELDVNELRRQTKLQRDYCRNYIKTGRALVDLLTAHHAGISRDILEAAVREYLHRLLIAHFVSLKCFNRSLIHSNLELDQIIKLSANAPSLNPKWRSDLILHTPNFVTIAKQILNFKYGEIDELIFGAIYEHSLTGD